MASPTIDPAYADIMKQVAKAGYVTGNPLKSTLDDARLDQARYFAFLNGELPELASTQDLVLPVPAGSLTLRVHRPSDEGLLPTILFMRGAGWWAGSIDSHELAARTLAQRVGVAVVVVDYHRAPECRFPTQRDELLTAIAWIRSHGAGVGLDASRMVLWGESAGATTCLLAAMMLRDCGLPLPDGLVLFYGNFDGPKPNLKLQSRWVWQQLLGHQFDSPPSEAVPAHQSVQNLPPIWLGCGDADPLLEDTQALQARLEAAHIPHDLRLYDGLPHGFMALLRLFEGAGQAMADAVQFISSLPTFRTRRHNDAAEKTR